MSKKTLLTLIFGFILILGLGFFSVNLGLKNLKTPGPLIQIDHESIKENFDADYNAVLEKMGGGTIQNNDINVTLEKEWLVNQGGQTSNDIFNKSGTTLLNAYLLTEESPNPWIYTITKIDHFEKESYSQKIQESYGEITKIFEDNAFLIEFNMGTPQRTMVLQKIIQTKKEEYLVLSLTTLSSSINEVKEAFDNLLNKTEILNYKETMVLNSF